MHMATQALQSLLGYSPSGWYTGRDSPNTHRLLLEQGGYLYDSDYYGDDLPFWTRVTLSDGSSQPHLVVPYTLDANDMRFASPQGFNTAEHFYQYLKDSFDTLYAEGDPAGLNQPKMLSIGMHCRLLGRPGRIVALQKFLDDIQQHEHVWICKCEDIAKHWIKQHPLNPTF
jgi:allantoinase